MAADPDPQPPQQQPPPPTAAAPRIFTWVAVSLTGVFGAGIVGLGLSARAKNDAYKNQLDMGLTPDPELKRTGQTYETLTNVSIIGCALSAAAAVTLFFVEGGKSSPERGASLQAGLVPTGAYVRGSF
jgi:hypothetical protein